MLYIKLFIEREKNIGQSAPECPFNRGTLKSQSNGPLYNNTVTGTLAVYGWAVARRDGTGLCNSPPINGQCTNIILIDVAL